MKSELRRRFDQQKMECDVIPDSPHEVDPLGNLENCNSLSSDGSAHIGSLNATIITSNEQLNLVPKSRKVLNIAPTKNRKLLAIRSVPSGSNSTQTTTTTVSKSNHATVSVINYLFLIFILFCYLLNFSLFSNSNK